MDTDTFTNSVVPDNSRLIRIYTICHSVLDLNTLVVQIVVRIFIVLKYHSFLIRMRYLTLYIKHILCEKFRSRWDGSSWAVSSGSTLLAILVLIYKCHFLAAMDVSKCRKGRVHFRNSGLKGLMYVVRKASLFRNFCYIYQNYLNYIATIAGASRVLFSWQMTFGPSNVSFWVTNRTAAIYKYNVMINLRTDI